MCRLRVRRGGAIGYLGGTSVEHEKLLCSRSIALNSALGVPAGGSGAAAVCGGCWGGLAAAQHGLSDNISVQAGCMGGCDAVGVSKSAL
jgi:hypothetical protein